MNRPDDELARMGELPFRKLLKDCTTPPPSFEEDLREIVSGVDWRAGEDDDDG